MHAYTLTHLSDAVLLRDLSTLITRDRATTAALLAHIAEADVRQLYLPAACPTMHAYCVAELRLSEDAAYKRIQAARAARRFPVLFTALAEGRLHLAAVCLLAPHLTPENVDELVAAATHRRKSEVEVILAGRFARAAAAAPAPDRLRAISVKAATAPSPGQGAATPLLEPLVHSLAPGQVNEPVATAAVAPSSPSEVRYALHVTINQRTQEKLRRAQALLGHAVPSGELGLVLDRALDALITQLEARKFAATKRPRPLAPQDSTRRERARTVPAPVRRAVWERDKGRCTFVSASGRHCDARRMLEFDHVLPVAQGGKATAENLRLRCRAHNQYEAERAFGAEFMRGKRADARQVVDGTRARKAAVAAETAMVTSNTRARAASP